MAPTIPYGEPTEVQAGDTWTWYRLFGSYPASEGYTLSYAIRGIDRLDWNAGWVTTTGNTFLVDIPAASTAALRAGRYRWAAHLTLSGDRYTGAEGVLNVTADLAEAAEGDLQTHEERMVVAIEAELEARVTGVGSALTGYQIGSRSLQKIPTEELTRLLSIYRAAVRRQRNPSCFGKTIQTRFVSPDRSAGTILGGTL